MAWMMDTYSMTQGKSVPGVVTGKPIIVGGSAGRREATGRGIVFVLYQAAKSLGQELRGKKIVVQGFGNVGSVAARLLWNDGCTIAGISDVKGGVWNPSGIDIRQLQDHVAQAGSVVGFPGAEPVSNEQILEQPCDVLIPAAVDSVIHARNADRIKALIVAEAANGPTTPEADVILRDHGVTVIPDILCNAGGVVVSYFEWVQGLQYRPEERRGPADRGADGRHQPGGRRPRVPRPLPLARCFTAKRFVSLRNACASGTSAKSGSCGWHEP
jgi:glutamate dehydrogenase (NAD(P)+)